MWSDSKRSANATDAQAAAAHGVDPQSMVPKILRTKIYAHDYWRNALFGLNAESLVDVAVATLQYVGGAYGGFNTPSPFVQLALKLLQIAPEPDIVAALITNEQHKYVTLLGAFYLRITGKAVEIYSFLEPLYNDYRKVRRRLRSGEYTIVHVDELIDEMLREEQLFDIPLPNLPKRQVLEDSGQLSGARRSTLDEEADRLEAEERARGAKAARCGGAPGSSSGTLAVERAQCS